MEVWKFSVEEVVRSSMAYKTWHRRLLLQLPVMVTGYALAWVIVIALATLVNSVLLRFGRGFPITFDIIGSFVRMLEFRWSQLTNSRFVARFIIQRVWKSFVQFDFRLGAIAFLAFLVLSFLITKKSSNLIKGYLYLRLYNKLRRLSERGRLSSENKIIEHELLGLFPKDTVLSWADRLRKTDRLVRLIQVHQF